MEMVRLMPTVFTEVIYLFFGCFDWLEHVHACARSISRAHPEAE
jgi:hypothetical protein